MLQLTTGILGAIALSLTLGAAQFASGRDLPDPTSSYALFGPEPAGGIAVNRAAKADRAAGLAGSPARSQTIALRVNGVSDRSLLVRVPVTNEAASPSSPAAIRPGNRKPIVACEAVVSLLTEVAKQLQPGRCVT
ncbi:MAG TPA: hypothetical protein VKS24_10440 [Bradyrhizobium sp.]|nr:hypothetical protein [Bradyrhizobium sp.]